jgi:phenylpropionate dioxygenase-like ring-hydroxylating dioxygenase large terminal subunit
MNQPAQRTLLNEPIRTDFVPASYFTAPNLPVLEKTRLFPKVWQVACREEEIPHVGDFVNYEICDESFLVVRTKKDEIKAFYNVCQHRGRRLRDEAKGSVAQGFYCRFHGWRYALDGSIVYVHDREDWKDCPEFKEGALNLKQPKVGRWAGWVWLNMDPGAEPLMDYLGAVADKLKPFDIDKMHLAWYETIIAPVNWKVIVEAFNEGYHAGATHAFALDYKRAYSPGKIWGRHSQFYTGFTRSLPNAKVESGQWLEMKSFQEMLYYQSVEIYETLFALIMEPMMKAVTRLKNDTKPDEPVENLLGKLWDWHKQELEAAGLIWPANLKPEDLATVATGYHMFPNTVMLPAVDGVLWYRMRPYGDDPDRCIFDIWCLRPYAPGTEPKVTQNITHGFEAFRGRNAFLEQDFGNMVAVNKGMKSQGWAGAVCSPTQEVQISNFHKVLREYMCDEPPIAPR